MPKARRRRPHHPTSRWGRQHHDIQTPTFGSEPSSSYYAPTADYSFEESYGYADSYQPQSNIYPPQTAAYGGDYEVRRHQNFAAFQLSHPPFYHETNSASSTRPPSPPREPRENRDWDRPVTPPLPQPPSPSYLALAEESPSQLSDPVESRKLLILDLNGTLVFRSQNGYRAKTRYYQRDGEDGPSDDRPLPRLRPVHPRPYMRAFRSYLFAPETKAWLDVMIWSSAQPHSVDDMVEKSFGEDRNHLLAVWARDTLGLPQDHYRRKVQTIKDLTKPWAQLSQLSSPHSSQASTPRSSPSRSHSPTTAPAPARAHSALTTLLLDDSPRKAELQPYNHVCIGEYSAALRARDLESFTKAADWAEAEAVRAQLEASELDADESFVSVAESEGAGADQSFVSVAESEDIGADESFVSVAASDVAGEIEGEGAPGTRKRKRKEKKRQQRLAGLREVLDAPRPAEEYDETLLCVVGVLEAVKRERNVAAWIRAGGLWGPAGVPVQLEKDGQEGERAPEPESARDGGGQASSDGGPRDKKRKRWQREKEVAAKAGNDEVTPAAADAAKTVVSNDAGAGAVDSSSGIKETPAPPMWFEHPPTVSYWAKRGREALERLGIPVEHGIER